MWCKPQRDRSLKQVTLSPTTVPYYHQAAVHTSFSTALQPAGKYSYNRNELVWQPISHVKAFRPLSGTPVKGISVTQLNTTFFV